MASTRFSSATRAAAAVAWSRPASERCNPGARPGSRWPVLGVWPCRTKSTSVEVGGLARRVVAMVGPSTYRRIVDSPTALAALTDEIVACRACPRLVAWREQVGREKRASFATEEYWAKPVPGFGDPEASVLVVGLAPAAHGGNRTGRVFTGDRSGDWLFRSMWRAGLANQPESRSLDDGLELIDAYIAAIVRCAPPANKPTVDERDRCRPYFERELALLRDVRVIVCLGAFAYDNVA